MPEPSTAPRRELGAFTCVAIGLTTIVGSGIFALPPKLAASLGPLSFLAFLGAAVVVSLIGLMTAEAAGTTDRTGGPYQYARMAFGPAAGFGIAWIAWVNNVVSWATVSLALVKLLDVLGPGLGSGRNAQWIATAEILALGIINACGVKPGAAVSNALTIGKLVPLVLFVAIGLAAFHPASFDGATGKLAAAGAGGFAVAVYRCIFPAGGFENIGIVAGEVTDPKRMIPRAVVLAIAVSTVLYALVQLAATSSVPDLASIAPGNQPGSVALPIAGERAATRLAGAAFGTAIYTVMLVGAIVSMTGYCAGVAIVAPRALFAMAEGGFVPKAVVRTTARGTPSVAILTVTAIAVASVWLADWVTLLDASILFSLVQHLTTSMAAWRLRRTVPTAGRFVAPGGPIVPLLTIVVVVLLCVFAFQPAEAVGGDAIDPNHFLSLAAVLAAGFAISAVTRVAERVPARA
ncbi:MAG TPA: APC family permease [Planctomycetota bacterium]|nr:APC family permease [Planctomycetota bacterium]